MAFDVGTVTQFDDPNSIMDPQVLISAKAVNLGINKGKFWNALSAPIAPLMDVVFEIYNRTKTTKGGAVGDGAGAGWDATATTDLPVDATSIKGLTVGSVLKVEDEYVVVKSADRTANTIDVWSRGAGGTTGAIHADTTAYSVIGFAGKDTDLKNVESISEATAKYENYCQTIFETLDWTFQAGNLARKGLTPPQIKTVLMNEAMNRVAENLAVTAVLGKKQEGAKGSNPYMTAGLLAQLADNAGGGRPVLSYNANGALTEAKLRSALQEVFQNGSPNAIWVNPTNKEIINGFDGSPTQVQLNRDAGSVVAGTTVQIYNYEGVSLNVMVDSDMPNDIIPIVNMSKCSKGWLQNDTLRAVEEPEISSREKRESIQGSVGIAIEDVGYEHTYIYGIV
jgi:hypothetical protein